MDSIPLEKCEDRYLYRISSRNLAYGVFREKTKGFIGIREKFGNEYLFEEYHWDTGSPFGTVNPVEKLEKLPDDIELRESLGTIEEGTKRPLKHNPDGQGWVYEDTGEPKDKDKFAVGVSNKALFDWLKEVRKN